MVSDPAVIPEVTRTAPTRQLGAWFRAHPEARTELTDLVDDQVGGLIGSVRVVSSGSITVSGASGTIPITIENAGPTEVTVGLELSATPSQLFSADPVEPFTIAPERRTSVEVTAQVAAAGPIPVTIQLVTDEGDAFGEPGLLVVESAAYANAARVLVQVALAALVLAVVVHGVRRARRRRRARDRDLAGAARAPGPDEAEGPAATARRRHGADAATRAPVTDDPRDPEPHGRRRDRTPRTPWTSRTSPARPIPTPPATRPSRRPPPSRATWWPRAPRWPLGTVISRITGLFRDIAMTAALGLGIVADIFTVGNTIPNTVYVLTVGGAMNAVFVPQLVRRSREDSDGGAGFTDRLLTLTCVLLLALTAIAMLLAPLLTRIYASPDYTADQMSLAVAFARFCLPQVFFYGLFTLVSQVLNARGRFSPPMYAPIANNLVAIFVFLSFLVVAGPAAADSGTLTAAADRVAGARLHGGRGDPGAAAHPVHALVGVPVAPPVRLARLGAGQDRRPGPVDPGTARRQPGLLHRAQPPGHHGQRPGPGRGPARGRHHHVPEGLPDLLPAALDRDGVPGHRPAARAEPGGRRPASSRRSAGS